MDKDIKLGETNMKLDEVKNQMHTNISIMLENQTKLESIELKSQELVQSSAIFAISSKDLAKRIWWKNMKIKIFVGTFVLIILTIIVGVCIGLTQTNEKN